MPEALSLKPLRITVSCTTHPCPGPVAAGSLGRFEEFFNWQATLDGATHCQA